MRARLPRSYGRDAYWIDRYARGDGGEDRTDEWLLGWCHLQPLLSSMLGHDAVVLDLGCGVSPLCFDLLREMGGACRVRAVAAATYAPSDGVCPRRCHPLITLRLRPPLAPALGGPRQGSNEDEVRDVGPTALRRNATCPSVDTFDR